MHQEIPRDDLVTMLEEALDSYFDDLDDLNDTDTSVLADNLADRLRFRGVAVEAAAPTIIKTAHGNCASCGKPFDASDTRWNGQGRHQNTDWCRACIDRCHDNESADHRCRVCA